MKSSRSSFSVQTVLRSGLVVLTLLTSSAMLSAAPDVPSAKIKPVAAVQDKVQNSATVNINTATAEELSQVLKGVGPAKAQAIIDYRTTYGPFKSVEELAEVKGIGPATLEKNAGLIVLKYCARLEPGSIW